MVLSNPAPPSGLIFVCERNATRSIIAESLAKSKGIDCKSAGLAPDTEIDPLVIHILQKHDLDQYMTPPKHLEDVIDEGNTYIALSQSVFEALRSLTFLKGAELEYWETPQPPSADQQRELAIEEIENIALSLRGHLQNRFGY